MEEVRLELRFGRIGEGRKARHAGGRGRIGKRMEEGMILLNEKR